MKNKLKKVNLILSMIIVLSILSMTFIACNKPTSMRDFAYTETADLEVAVLSDIHYVSPTLIESTSLDNYSIKDDDPKAFAISGAILKTALDKIVESGIKYIFIPGDIADSHAIINHTEVAEIFSKVEEQGVQIFVAPGNHDVCETAGFEGWRYTSSGLERVPDFYNPVVGQERDEENTIANQFKSIYNEFGYSDAIEVNGLSYVANVGDKFRLIVIDNCSVDLSSETIMWAKQQVENAISADKTPIAMIHKPINNIMGELSSTLSLIGLNLNDLVSYQSTMLKNNLAKAGLKFLLTGHLHSNNIATLTTTDESASMYDIMTSSLIETDNSYRKLRFSQNYVVGTVETVDAVNASYLPDMLSSDERTQITQNLSNYSFEKLKKYVGSNISTNDSVIKEKLANAVYGTDNQIPSGFDDFLQKSLIEFVSLPFYKSEGGENSVEALYQKYDATLPSSGYKNIIDLVACTMRQVLAGSENFEANQSMVEMLDASLKAVIVSLIDNGLFELRPDIFEEVSSSVMKSTCTNLLKEGKFELLDSRIMNNMLQLPFITEIKDEVELIAPFIPDSVTTQTEFAEAVNAISMAGSICGMDLEPYFENIGIDDDGNKIYSGLFFSDDCLREQFFGTIALNLIDDTDVLNRDFVIDLRTFDYE